MFFFCERGVLVLIVMSYDELYYPKFEHNVRFLVGEWAILNRNRKTHLLASLTHINF